MITRRSMFTKLFAVVATFATLEVTAVQAFAKPASFKPIAPPIDLTHWEAAYGRVYAIKDMTTKHIVNCIRFIRREQFREEYLPAFKAELNSRFGSLPSDAQFYTGRHNRTHLT